MNAVARRLKRIGVRSDITSDEEVTKKRKKPPAASSPNAAKSTIEKGSSESLLPEDSNVMNGFDPESDSLASYVEVVYSAYETAQDTVDEREKESFKVTENDIRYSQVIVSLGAGSEKYGRASSSIAEISVLRYTGERKASVSNLFR